MPNVSTVLAPLGGMGREGMELPKAPSMVGIACAGVDPPDSVRSTRQKDMLFDVSAIMSGGILAGQGQMLLMAVD